MPGTGKTTVGTVLSRLMRRPFVDLDGRIEEQLGRPVHRIIEEEGEEAFRQAERVVWRDVLSDPSPAVVACGGGTLLTEEARTEASRDATIVLLTASLEELARRLQRSCLRPILGESPAVNRIDQLWQTRRPQYEAVVHRVDTTSLTPSEAAVRVRRRLLAAGWAQSELFGGPSDFLEAGSQCESWMDGGWERAYPVLVDARDSWMGLADSLKTLLPGGDFRFLVDSGIPRAEVSRLKTELNLDENFLLSVSGGESGKCWERVAQLAQWLLSSKASHRTTLVAVGGGAVLDAVGVLATSYLRGVRWVTVPTTMLSAVDASLGGKTAVNLGGVKNMLGHVWHPSLVYVPVAVVRREVLQREVSDGFIEALKMECLFGSRNSMTAVADAWDHRREMDLGSWSRLIQEACRHKIRVVGREIREEASERILLNLGHTFAHAVEGSTGFRMSHGQAVAWGMVVAARVSRMMNLTTDDVVTLVETLVSRFPGVAAKAGPGLPDLSAVRFDKKGADGDIREVLFRDAGRPEVVAISAVTLQNLMSQAL
jgi:3-dehydroquinate synthetase/shikimate kinase